LDFLLDPVDALLKGRVDEDNEVDDVKIDAPARLLSDLEGLVFILH